MEKDHLEFPLECATCGGPLSSGPFGPRCARCVLSLAGEMENDAVDRAAEFFPELHIQCELAHGGFGAVFRAEHRRMKRPVALKFLDVGLARATEAVALFEREMITVGGLDHPGIVRAYDAGQRDGQWYITMEFVDGLDCGALVRKHGALPMAESCEIIRQAAVALHHAHEKGLVHRDVKPGNLMVSKGTEAASGTPAAAEVLSVPVVPPSVKVLDFGLAGLVVAPVFSPPAAAEGSTLFLGTLEYVAPEQLVNPDTADSRADVFGLGATLWRLLTGKTPHADEADLSLFVHMKRITTEPVPPIAKLRPDLPKPLAQLCDRMLSLDREHRPASAAEVARLLEPWCAGAELPRLFSDGPLEEKPIVFPKKNRHRWWIAAGVAALGVLGAALYQSGRKAAATDPAAGAAKSWKPLYSAAYARERHVNEDATPQLWANDWEFDSEIIDAAEKDCGRIAPDGSIISIGKEKRNPLRRTAAGKTTDAVVLASANVKVRGLGVAPTGHLVWGMPDDKNGLHLGRALPDGTLLPTLRYDFAAEFPPGTYEKGREMMLTAGMGVADGQPWNFAFVTAENLPPNTGLKEGDVLVVDSGHRVFLQGLESTPGLWRFRLDDNAPARRIAKSDRDWLIGVAVTRRGVFVLDMIQYYTESIPADSSDHLNRRLLRWDQTGWHACTFDKPIFDPSGLAADPLSDDIYIMQGNRDTSVGSDVQRISRLRLTGPDHYSVEPFVTRLGKPGYNGIAFTPDGRKMIITDPGNFAIVVLKRNGVPSSAPDVAMVPAVEPKAAAKPSEAEIPGWVRKGSLSHTSEFTSPQLFPGNRVIYCAAKRLRIVSDTGGYAENFIDPKLLGSPKFCGVDQENGFVAWTRKAGDVPGIGRATAEGKLMSPLEFDDGPPTVPGGFAIATTANAPPSLRPGDVLVACSASEAHPGSKSGIWRFRFDNEDPVALVAAVDSTAATDVTISKAGVFLLCDGGIRRWDGIAFHPTILTPSLQQPIALAADPLTTDLYALERNRLLRLRPTAPDTCAVEVLTDYLDDAVRCGLCFSVDGKRLLLGEFGGRKTWVLGRRD